MAKEFELFVKARRLKKHWIEITNKIWQIVFILM
jgi:hypothetical protein